MSASAIEIADTEGYPVNTHIRINEHAPSLDDLSFDKMFGGLPLVTHRVGETILTAGSNTGRLLILKRGEVAIIKDFIEIARVKEPGAVIGELSVLLGSRTQRMFRPWRTHNFTWLMADSWQKTRSWCFTWRRFWRGVL